MNGGAGGGNTQAVAPKTNTPNATFTYTGPSGAASKLRIVTAKITADKPLMTVFQEWLVEVVNDSSETLCLANMKAFYKNASGTVVASPMGYVNGPSYKVSGLSVTSSCLAPGDHGVIWDLDTVPTVIDPSAVRVIEYQVEFLPANGIVPHPNMPTITPGVTFDKFNSGNYSLKGSLVAKASIHNVGLDIFPVGSDGLILAALSATNLGAVVAGATWNWESSSAEENFSKQFIFADWIEGVAAVPLKNHALEALFLERRDDFSSRHNRIRDLASKWALESRLH